MSIIWLQCPAPLPVLVGALGSLKFRYHYFLESQHCKQSRSAEEDSYPTSERLKCLIIQGYIFVMSTVSPVLVSYSLNERKKVKKKESRI